jgi:hypothetical protein
MDRLAGVRCYDFIVYFELYIVGCKFSNKTQVQVQVQIALLIALALGSFCVLEIAVCLLNSCS